MSKETALKKEFAERDIQRIRNIVTKKYGEKTVTQVGYSKSHEDHKEGDIWEENDKTWTIKNGIKQNITKMDDFKSLAFMPIMCPKCNTSMNHHLDKKFYKMYQQCFDCQIKYETQLRIEGKYEEYEKNIIKENAKTWIKDLENAFDSFINTNDTFVTEMGDVEAWNGGEDKQKAIEEFKQYVEGFKSAMEI